VAWTVLRWIANFVENNRAIGNMDIQTSWWWSSHAPLLQAAVDVFRPDFILELGSGQFSTPIFAASDARVWSIDNDQEWLQKAKESLSADSRVEFIFHDLGPEVLIGTKPYELSESKRNELIRYYEDLSDRVPDSRCKFAFVDQFTAARTFSINALLGKFDVIIYHDCEPAGIPWYEYYFDQVKCQEYELYTFKTPVVWTGLFVRKSLNFDGFELCRLCKLHADRYAKVHGLDPTELFLQRGR
jgi:hypothetical protein